MGSYQNAIVDRYHGWRVVPILEWLTGDGCELDDSNELLRSLAMRMLLERAPIVSLRLSIYDAKRNQPGWSAVWSIGKTIHQNRTAEPSLTRPGSYLSSHISHVDRTRKCCRQRLEKRAKNEISSYLQNLASQGATDYIHLPLRTPSTGHDSLAIVTDRIGGFEKEDVCKFDALALAFAPTFAAVEQRRRLPGSRTS